MKKYEKLAVALIALLLFTHIAAFARDIYLAQAYGASGPPLSVQKQWEFVSLLLARLVNIGAAVWLFIDAKREKFAHWVWAAFGLVFGLLGLVVYYVLLAHVQSRDSARQET